MSAQVRNNEQRRDIHADSCPLKLTFGLRQPRALHCITGVAK
jgi:hypothetical protein